MKRFLLAAAIGAAACGCTNQSAGTEYKVYGYGTQSCGAWTKDADATKSIGAFAKEAWLLGFISGAGWAGHSMRETDLEGLVAAMNKHCEQFPTDSIAKAAAAVATLLER